MVKGRKFGTVKYLHPIYNDPLGVYEHRHVINFLKRLSKGQKNLIKNKQGRPFGSVKYKDNKGKPINVFEWRKTTIEGKKSKKNYFIKRQYGINILQYEDMLIKQEGMCLICKTPFTKELKAHIDHDHKTDKIRGLLCFHCNHLLGNAKDDKQILKNAISYLNNPIL